MQALQGVRVVAFDKTGTLTMGHPDLTEVEPLEGDADAFLVMVAALEAVSEHPVAGAVVRAAKARGLPLPAVTQVEAEPGFGLRGVVAGRSVMAGAPRYFEREGIVMGTLGPRAEALAAMGRSLILVAVDGRMAGLLAVSDRIKPEAAQTVARLTAMGLRVAMVTGDAPATAAHVAKTLGIQDVRAGVLPGGKVDAIRDLQRIGPVAYVGDGINDAPALAAADVGVAIGTGTDVAVESAHVVLMSGNPAGVVNALEISRRTMANIRQNLMWAFGYNVLLVPVAAGVLYPVWGVMLSPALAAGAMALSSVLVVTNALRLRRVPALVGEGVAV